MLFFVLCYDDDPRGSDEDDEDSESRVKQEPSRAEPRDWIFGASPAGGGLFGDEGFAILHRRSPYSGLSSPTRDFLGASISRGSTRPNKPDFCFSRQKQIASGFLYSLPWAWGLTRLTVLSVGNQIFSFLIRYVCSLILVRYQINLCLFDISEFHGLWLLLCLL